MITTHSSTSTSDSVDFIREYIYQSIILTFTTRSVIWRDISISTKMELENEFAGKTVILGNIVWISY
jgi:hypothetical protein